MQSPVSGEDRVASRGKEIGGDMASKEGGEFCVAAEEGIKIGAEVAVRVSVRVEELSKKF